MWTESAPFRIPLSATSFLFSPPNNLLQQASSLKDGNHCGTHFSPLTSKNMALQISPLFDFSSTQSCSPVTPRRQYNPSDSNVVTLLASTITMSIYLFNLLSSMGFRISTLTCRRRLRLPVLFNLPQCVSTCSNLIVLKLTKLSINCLLDANFPLLKNSSFG
jgi:hypothetical protein